MMTREDGDIVIGGSHIFFRQVIINFFILKIKKIKKIVNKKLNDC
jgi:hypothetical protein